jgi:hypothetical protein
MKKAALKDEMNLTDNDVADAVKQQVKQRTSRKANTAIKKTDNVSDGKDIRYDDVKNNLVLPGNVIADAELIPFGRRMSNNSVPIDSYISIESAIESQKLLERFVNEVLIADVDYGFIQGYGKPSLLKSGAEKICNFYRLVPKVEILNRIDDYTIPFFSRETKVILVDYVTGTIRAEGVGTCNSREAKFRGDDVYSLQNTIQKLSKKRSYIDAVLNVSGISSRFTQDIEDITMFEGGFVEPKPITMKQYKYLTDLIRINGISRDEYFQVLADNFNVESLKQLDSAQMSQLIAFIKARKNS